MRFHRTLYGQVLAATAAGVAVGYFWPAAGAAMKPLGDGFVKLVRMIVAPVIFCTVVAGIAGSGGVKTVGKAGVLALIYFEVVTTVSLAIGLLVVNVARPGAGMNVAPSTLDAAAAAQYVSAGRTQSAASFLLDIIPSSAIDAFARGDLLQVLLVSVLFAFALKAIGPAGAVVVHLIDTMSRVVFGMVAIIMRAAPIGAFGAMAFTIGNFGVGALASMGKVIASFYAACLLFIALVLGAIARAHRFSVWRFVAAIREEIFVVLGTSSSESALPRLMEKLETFGVSRSVVGVVVPAGYSFNLDGTAIYLAIATVFIAQATNTPLGPGRQIALLAVLLVTSKGAAGVAGAALVALAATLSTSHDVPAAGIALILGIHRFMGEAMAVTNLIGNGVATIVIGKWCGEVDEAKLSALGVPAPADLVEPRAVRAAHPSASSG